MLPTVASLNVSADVSAFAPPPQIEWLQTALHTDSKFSLAKSMSPIELLKMGAPTGKAIVIDRTQRFQTLLGFGGAFTEAAARNWRSLSAASQAEVIRRYFATPADGGLGYTVGRVPMGSCDFMAGGASSSYSFHNVSGDVNLKKFDDSVAHDEDSGMLPMIRAAQAAIKRAGGKLHLFASPWSPPAWMKLPVGGVYSMQLTAMPNGLNPQYQEAYARYFSKFISAYENRGVDIWAVTVQNEPDAGDVPWDKCHWTPDFELEFVQKHLGPLLEKEHPSVKIIGFDHNKGDVVRWAKVLYKDFESKKYFAGIGVHWYGGLQPANLEKTHEIAPDKFILATEACNCGGVAYQTNTAEWWGRAERLGMDIMQDLLHWAIGWVDWNLVLDTKGGPNKIGNTCDANIIADPTDEMGYGSIVLQPSYYYMGHFSKYLPPGSVRVGVQNTVLLQSKKLSAVDVKKGDPLVFLPCFDSELQSWTIDGYKSLFVERTTYMCADISGGGKGPRLNTEECTHSQNQMWERRTDESCSNTDVTCFQLVNPASDTCLTVVTSSGAAIGLDAGTTYQLAQAQPCKEIGDRFQTFFDYIQGDPDDLPKTFPVRLPPLPEADTSSDLCLQPYIIKKPIFDTVAFKTPDGSISLIAINNGDDSHTFTLYDETYGLGARDITIPPHSIQSYTLPTTTTTTTTIMTTTTTSTTTTTVAPLWSSSLAIGILAVIVIIMALGLLAIAARLLSGGCEQAHSELQEETSGEE